MEREIIRIPRPMGITQMVKEYNKLEGDEKASCICKIRDYLINQWMLGNGNICGKSYSINELSRFLNIDPSYIQIYMRDQVIGSRIWDKDLQQQIFEGLMGQQLSWVLEDRMEVQSQLEILKASQGGKYTPFVSAELNKALKLKLETSTSLQSIIRTLSGGGTVNNNFFTQINNNGETNNADAITKDEALKLIESSQGNMSVDEKRALPVSFIESNYELENLPVVCALEQEGVDTSKEGLSLNKNELSQAIDNYKGAIEVSDMEFEEIEKEIDSRYHHEHRRQLEIGEDLDADDPECKIYDEHN